MSDTGQKLFTEDFGGKIMGQWKVELIGHDFDLQFLLKSDWVDTDVVEEEGKYYLQSTHFDSLTEPDGVRNAAIKLVQKMNGIQKVKSPSFQNVAIGHVVQIGDDGRVKSHVLLRGALTLRGARLTAKATVTTSGEEMKHPDEAEDWSAIASEIVSRNPKVAKALNFFAKESNQINLYKVYEIIEEDLGGEKKLRDQLELAKAEIRALRAWSNNPTVSGDDARHALGEGFSGRNISDKEAEQIVRSMLRKWIDLNH